MITNPESILMRTSIKLVTKQIYNFGIVIYDPWCIYSPLVPKQYSVSQGYPDSHISMRVWILLEHTAYFYASVGTGMIMSIVCLRSISAYCDGGP